MIRNDVAVGRRFIAEAPVDRAQLSLSEREDTPPIVYVFEICEELPIGRRGGDKKRDYRMPGDFRILRERRRSINQELLIDRASIGVACTFGHQ